jgi:hypothetical protein
MDNSVMKIMQERLVQIDVKIGDLRKEMENMIAQNDKLLKERVAIQAYLESSNVEVEPEPILDNSAFIKTFLNERKNVAGKIVKTVVKPTPKPVKTIIESTIDAKPIENAPDKTEKSEKKANKDRPKGVTKQVKGAKKPKTTKGWKDAVKIYLYETGGATKEEILSYLAERKMIIGGTNPILNLPSMLSRRPEEFKYNKRTHRWEVI